jgi:hypothetical protein
MNTTMSTTTVRVTRTTHDFFRGEVTPVREVAEALARTLRGKPLPYAVHIEHGDWFRFVDLCDDRALYITDLDDDDERHIALTVGPDGLVVAAEFCNGLLIVAA